MHKMTFVPHMLPDLDDVEAANQLTLDVQLRVRGPLGIRLQPLPHLTIVM